MVYNTCSILFKLIPLLMSCFFRGPLLFWIGCKTTGSCKWLSVYVMSRQEMNIRIQHVRLNYMLCIYYATTSRWADITVNTFFFFRLFCFNPNLIVVGIPPVFHWISPSIAAVMMLCDAPGAASSWWSESLVWRRWTITASHVILQND